MSRQAIAMGIGVGFLIAAVYQPLGLNPPQALLLGIAIALLTTVSRSNLPTRT